MENTSTNTEEIFLVWYEEGMYTQHRFLMKCTEEEVKKKVKELNDRDNTCHHSELSDKENPDEWETGEYWDYTWVDFKN